ncbi:hypothetical protein [Compostimonas suwonensis]|uniref:Uncharacterized protein n=1 Tax=Compostimonas suwonensis TaxID=1048394 RepID=A0A2M9BUC2_9MICO|nr:hypothetical protein [Compostimonas suwonensis]PJJ61521.1 hypothetical protein CLV54_2466 [Compostimonas suwonensis]
MIRVLFSVGIGALLASVGAWIVSGDEAWAGLVIPLAIISSVFLPLILIARSVAGIGGGGRLGLPLSAEEVAAAAHEGRLHLARVTSIRRTGTTINDQPVCDIDLVVVPDHGAAFSTTTRKLVDILEIPRLQPECVVVVAQPAGPATGVQLVMSPPDEWVQRAASDERVRTTRTAPPQTAGAAMSTAGTVSAPSGASVPTTAILNPSSSVAPAAGPATKPPRTSGLRRIPPVFYVLGILLGAGLALVPCYPTIAAIANGETTLDEVRRPHTSEGEYEQYQAEQAAQEEARRAAEAAADMFVGDNAQKAVDAIVEAAGGPQLTSLYFGGQFASADAPSSPGAQTLDTFDYTDGVATRDGAAASQPDPGELDAELFDVSGIDMRMLPSLVERAKQLSGLGDALAPGSSQSAYIGVTPVVIDDALQYRVMIRIPVDGEYYDASIGFDPTGIVLEMSGGAPGSESYQAGNG